MAYTHDIQIERRSASMERASKAVIMLHGRGSTAANILALQQHLHVGGDAVLLAPQATNNSWYPYSFMAPTAQNQPAFESAIALVDQAVKEAVAMEIAHERIYFLGFSQGACLALEYATRHARPYGGVVAFTGGLIGGSLDRSLYKGNFSGTPVLISAGDDDPHVPLHRIRETESIMAELGASLTVDIYPGKPHSISVEELDKANTRVFGKG